MRLTKAHIILFLTSVIGAVFLFGGCGNSDGKTPMATYAVTVTNLTNNQPLSPLAVVLHGTGYTGWALGTPASDGLEKLAEGGDPQPFLDEAVKQPSLMAVATGTGIITPGGGETVTLTAAHSSDLKITVATMLVNTNDGFTGIGSLNIGALSHGESLTVFAPVYDGGTEENTETAASIPGPAGGGEGYNPARETRDFVAIHSGVVTADDGLTASALDESHRFMTPAAVIVVTRTK